jgi:hypothetical protein
METGILMEALPLWADDFDTVEASGTGVFLTHIRREGVRL